MGSPIWPLYPLSWRKLFLLAVFLIVFINEYVVYIIQSHRWPSMPADRSDDPSEEQVVLLVADPQLQGYQDEQGFPIGQLTRWDIDRYLSKTFAYAYAYSKPDVVLFLGDIFDEGSKALGDEYMATLDRFNSIFSAAKFAKKIVIPGDNDIGGEMRDIRTARKMERFRRNFEEIVGVTSFNFVDYIKLDMLPHTLSQEKIRQAEDLARRRTGTFPVLINHTPLFSPSKHFLYPVLKRLRAQLILSGHWHKVAVHECDDCLKDNMYSWNIQPRSVMDLSSYISIGFNNETLVEIQTPACSYRMGVSDIGYGVLIISSNRKVRYTVLWLPQRYRQLYGYVIVFTVLLVAWFLDSKLRLHTRTFHKR